MAVAIKRCLSDSAARAVAGTRALAEHAAKRLRPTAGISLTIPSEAVENEGRDNAKHDFICRIGEKVYSRDTGLEYEFAGKLGQGTFGQVLQCRCAGAESEGRPQRVESPRRQLGGRFSEDRLGRLRPERVALKIINRQQASVEEALAEVEILTYLRDEARQVDERTKTRGLSHIVAMIDAFGVAEYGHLFIALELLGPDLYEFSQASGRPGLPMAFVRTVTSQMLGALSFLAAAAVIHADLKPENVLLADSSPLVNLQRPCAKIIDFGCARTVAQLDLEHAEAEHAHRRDIEIQSLPYRAPEVLLGCRQPFTCVVDMWSLGCICVELFLGKPLFSHDYEPLDVMHDAVKLFGEIPKHMLRDGRATGDYFERESRPSIRKPLEVPPPSGGWWPRLRARFGAFPQSLAAALSNVEYEEVFRLKGQQVHASSVQTSSREEAIDSLPYELQTHRPEVLQRTILACGCPQRLTREAWAEQQHQRRAFLDLLQKALEVDPANRLTAAAASKHRFLGGGPMLG